MIIVMPDGTFGRNVHDLRRKKRISLAKMAELTGIPYLKLYCIEQGTLLDVDYDHLVSLCDVLRVSQMELVTHRPK